MENLIQQFKKNKFMCKITMKIPPRAILIKNYKTKIWHLKETDIYDAIKGSTDYQLIKDNTYDGLGHIFIPAIINKWYITL